MAESTIAAAEVAASAAARAATPAPPQHTLRDGDPREADGDATLGALGAGDPQQRAASAFAADLAAARAARDAGYRTYPIAREIYADATTPIRVLRILQAASERCFLLEGAEDPRHAGRYSFLGFEPAAQYTLRGGVMRVRDRDGAVAEHPCSDPGAEIERVLAEHRSPRVPGLPRFTGGLVGYLSYETIAYAEPDLHLAAADPHHYDDADLMLIDAVIAFDHFRQRISVIVSVPLAGSDDELSRAVAAAGQRTVGIINLIEHGELAPAEPGRITSPVRRLFEQPRFEEMVERAKHYIHEGDIFQVVLSNLLEADFEGSLLDTYRAMRTINPSPYMFYLRMGGDAPGDTGTEVAGASPETLAKLEDGVLQAFPLAGTRPRAATPEADDAVERELLADPKELAEHNMLVDLERNDVGRVCEFGTVRVDRYLQVLRYSHVMHIGSAVSGRLRADRTGMDALGSILPAGTLSGAPKFRACQIIDELEGSRRGVYGGAVGYLGFNGDMDTCIGIRLAVRTDDGVVQVRSGAGIVADSDPAREYQETINKAGAVWAALREADGGLQ